MIAIVEIAYGMGEIVKALPEEKYRIIADHLGWEPWEKHLENIQKPHFYPHFLGMVDLSSLGPILTQNGIEFTVKRFPGTYDATVYFEKIAGKEDKERPLHVHLPNVGLLSVEEVILLEDACTNDLQQHLDDQWRIICVCPPNSARRPDYVLGRPKDAKDRTWTHGGKGRWT